MNFNLGSQTLNPSVLGKGSTKTMADLGFRFSTLNGVESETLAEMSIMAGHWRRLSAAGRMPKQPVGLGSDEILNATRDVISPQ